MAESIGQVAGLLLFASLTYITFVRMRITQLRFPLATHIGPVRYLKEHSALIRAYKCGELDDPVLTMLVRKYLYGFRIMMICLLVLLIVIIA